MTPRQIVHNNTKDSN